MSTLRILHFADAHIDMANYGRHDPKSGLPLRVLDFLKSLDVIVDTAVKEKLDLVLFAGDAYKDRAPAPTFQREWGKRIMRLSREGIPTLLLVGNHDLSPAIGRANAVQEFETLEVPNVHVLSKPQFLGANELDLPLQVIALPWIPRSGKIAALEVSGKDQSEVYNRIQEDLTEMVTDWLEKADPNIPIVMMAHASIDGADFGSERMVMLGADFTLHGALVKNKRLDYVALGHIHKAQDLNKNAHPPVIYPGSIERVDFGEANEKKYFVIAHVSLGKTKVEWREIKHTRPFMDLLVKLDSTENVTEKIISALPEPSKTDGAILRLTIEYPRDWDTLIDEPALRTVTSGVFEFHLIRRPKIEARIRLPVDQTASSLNALDLLDQYWRASHVDKAERRILQRLATDIIADEEAQASDLK